MPEGRKNVICEIADNEEDVARRHVLIVDDDVDMLKTLRFYLRDVYRVSILNCGEMVEEFVARYGPDLVLLDYLMPGVNGGEVIRGLEENPGTRGTRVLFLTGKTDQETIAECLSYHPEGYIVKPVAKHALLSKLESIFGGDRGGE